MLMSVQPRDFVRRLTAVLLGILPGLLSLVPARAGSLPPEAIRSVVRVFGNQNCASGFLLENGDLVTNAHVVHDVCRTLPCAGVRLHIATTVGEEITDEITPTRFVPRFISDAVDLAIVSLEGGPARKGFFKLAGAPTSGQHLTLAGFPGCGRLTVAEGAVKEIDAIGFLSSVQVRSGNSGSPVLDDQLRVVGVARRYANEATGKLRKMTGGNPVDDSKVARADLLPQIAPGGASAARALVEAALRYQEEAFALSGEARTARIGMLDELVDFLRGDLTAIGEPAEPGAAVLSTPLWRLPALELGDDQTALMAERVAIGRRLGVDRKLPPQLLPSLTAVGRPVAHLRKVEALASIRMEDDPPADRWVGFVVVGAGLLLSVWGFSVGCVFSATPGSFIRRVGIAVVVALAAWPLSLLVWWLLRRRRRQLRARSAVAAPI
jgi:hypothetical protein